MRTRIAIVLVLLSLASTLCAETVRGKVVYADGVTAYANVEVTLVSKDGKATVYTGPDGMFQLVRVAPGQYRIDLRSGQAAKSVNIVVSAQPYTDLPPVTLP